MKYLLIIFIIGCAKEERILTNNQAKFINSLSYEKQAVMEDCLSTSYHSYTFCVQVMESTFNPEKPSRNERVNTGPSAGDIALGTALGIGATKLIFGN